MAYFKRLNTHLIWGRHHSEIHITLRHTYHTQTYISHSDIHITLSHPHFRAPHWETVSLSSNTCFSETTRRCWLKRIIWWTSWRWVAGGVWWGWSARRAGGSLVEGPVAGETHPCSDSGHWSVWWESSHLSSSETNNYTSPVNTHTVKQKLLVNLQQY